MRVESWTLELTEPTWMTSVDPEEAARSRMGSSKDSLTMGRKHLGTKDLMKVLKWPPLAAATEQPEEEDAREHCLSRAGVVSLSHDPSKEKREVLRPGFEVHQRWVEGQE